jgi:anti-anti-sigma factor
VPLYACERCGFTSAAFRVDAAAAHRIEYPNCGGVIGIIFHSEDRYRSRTHGRHRADLPARAPGAQEGEGPATQAGREFAIRERFDADGMLRVTLLGELDLAEAHRLTARLAEHKSAERPVRLDLSKLAFIDSSGVQALLVALADARWQGWHLEVAREVSPTVERAAQIVGIAQVLWPQDPGPRQPGAAPWMPPSTA